MIYSLHALKKLVIDAVARSPHSSQAVERTATSYLVPRRDFVKSVLVSSAVAATLEVAETPARAAGLTPLDPSDPTARSLGFVSDASKVNPSANPTFKAGEDCASCNQFQGKPTDATAGCKIFAGRSVPAGGWCRVFAPRSS